ncbi:MAG: ABC transporter permease [Haliscomenobacter sp.]|nr:ABC transporter permease [Haliscomenobacter sp.]MBK7477130.1 ABC transporter permease [Haliscomenobacter sp.]MBK8878623.1 ABC transporter permease [Haliscomenobacter sp.]
MNLLALSWKNLINKPLSLLLSLVLFSLGVGLVSLLLLVTRQLEEKFEKNLAGIDLVIGAKGSPLQLILSGMYHIDAPTGNIPISEVRPFLNPRHPLIQKAVPLSLGDSYRNYRIVGTTSAFFDLYQAAIAEGRSFENVMEAVAGAEAARALGLKIGDTFRSSHGLADDEDMEHKESSFTLCGILKPTGSVADQLILTPAQSIWAVHDHGSVFEEAGEEPHEDHEEGHEDHETFDIAKPLTDYPDKDITSLLIQFKGRNIQTLNMQRSINENTDLQAATPAIEITRLYTLLGLGADALRWLAFVIIAVSGLSIFISLYSSLKDRRYELALMRTMGASPSTLFALIILEGLFLAVIGYLIGMLLSHGGMQLLAGFMKDTYRYTFTGTQFLKEEGFLLLGALAVGFLASVIPAFQASHTDIHETLADGGR